MDELDCHMNDELYQNAMIYIYIEIYAYVCVAHRTLLLSMSVSDSMINIVDLPDEMLLTIFNKLRNIDMLYSLVGVNRKLDTVACDINFTRTIRSDHGIIK